MILVHGGAHGAWCWQATRAALTTCAIAVDLPPRAIRGVRASIPPPPETAHIGLRDFADVVELDTGHDVMISAPRALAALLDEIADGGR